MEEPSVSSTPTPRTQQQNADGKSDATGGAGSDGVGEEEDLTELLYGGLDARKRATQSQVDELTTRLDASKAESDTLKAENTKLKAENASLARQVGVLERNISCLYKTAVTELDRKDKQLRELQQR